MAMRYTKVTREILSFIDEYGFITTRICGNIFYKGKSNGYIQARVKLNKMNESNILTRYKDPYTNEYIYQYQKEMIGDHKKYILRFYSEIFNRCERVDYFKTEESWLCDKRRCDAHIVYFIKDKEGNEKARSYLIELDKHHKTKSDKYIELYDSGCVHEWYHKKYGVKRFPTVLVISPLGTTKCADNRFKTITLNYRFEGIEELLE